MSSPVSDAPSPAHRASAVRHSIRNRLSAIRNAAFYLARKTRDAGLHEADPRIAQFFALIERELGEVDEIVAAEVTIEHLLGARGDVG